MFSPGDLPSALAISATAINIPRLALKITLNLFLFIIFPLNFLKLVAVIQIETGSSAIAFVSIRFVYRARNKELVLNTQQSAA